MILCLSNFIHTQYMTWGTNGTARALKLDKILITQHRCLFCCHLVINFCLTPCDIDKVYTQPLFVVRLSTITKKVHTAVAPCILKSLLERVDTLSEFVVLCN